MNPTLPETVETSQRFAFTGGVSLTLLVFIGIVLAGGVAWVVWRESRLTRRWLLPVLWLTRVVALSLVLWALAGPAMVTLVRRTRSKSIAIVVDKSASMGVVDSSDETFAKRWSQATQRYS